MIRIITCHLTITMLCAGFGRFRGRKCFNPASWFIHPQTAPPTVPKQRFLPSRSGGHDLVMLSSTPWSVLRWEVVLLLQRVPACAAGEEAGNARHSRAALYAMGDNGRRAERQGCAPGHVPHQHHIHTVWTGSSLSCPPPITLCPALVILLIQSGDSMLVWFGCKSTLTALFLVRKTGV